MAPVSLHVRTDPAGRDTWGGTGTAGRTVGALPRLLPLFDLRGEEQGGV
jgi:hypothetical protein